MLDLQERKPKISIGEMVHEQSRNPEEDGGEEPSVSTVHSSQLFRTPPVTSLRTDEDSGGYKFQGSHGVQN